MTTSPFDAAEAANDSPDRPKPTREAWRIEDGVYRLVPPHLTDAARLAGVLRQRGSSPRPCARCGAEVAPLLEGVRGDWVPPFCAPCQDAADAEEEAAEREAHRREVIKARLKHSGIDEDRLDELDRLGVTINPDLASLPRNGEGSWAYLSSSVPGCGKTTQLQAMVRSWIERGRRCRYVEMPRLLGQLKAAPVEERQRLLDELEGVDLLALDEFGRDLGMEWHTELTLNLLDRRYSARRATLIASNWTLDQIARIPGLDLRVESRIWQMVGGRIIGGTPRLLKLDFCWRSAPVSPT